MGIGPVPKESAVSSWQGALGSLVGQNQAGGWDTRDLGKGRAQAQIPLWHQQTLPVDREELAKGSIPWCDPPELI